MGKDDYAFVTLATDDNYCRGALVLAHSLRRVETQHKLVVLITAGVSDDIRTKLLNVFDIVQDVTVMDSEDETNLSLMQRPELGITFTKLHCWKLTQFSKCVFLDADTLVVRNCDELFEREELSAVPDVGWPDCFNSGVFVFQPSDETYQKLVEMAIDQGSFDGGDQGLLNTYFKDWVMKDISRHLSFIYNMNTSTSYTYLPAYKQFGKNVKIVHFLGNQKPWMCNYNKKTGTVEPSDKYNHSYEHLHLWWSLYIENVETQETIDAEISKNMGELDLGSPTKEKQKSSPVFEKSISDQSARMYAWEHGQIDYLGRDSFENIQQKLDGVINGQIK